MENFVSIVMSTYHLDFIYNPHDGKEKPKCVLCYETLYNESMKPAKLCRHLEMKNKENMNKLVEYFQRGQQELLS